MALRLPPSTLPNCSLSWTQNGRSEQRIQQNNASLPTLDLHGYTKEKAIRSLTDFLERSAQKQQQRKSSFVRIITGTGSHSGAMGGPVLKQAVHKLLIKRDMEFSYTKKHGLFLVNVHSGHVLKQNPTAQELHLAAVSGSGASGMTQTESLSQDTKVRIMPRDHEAARLLPNQKKRNKKQSNQGTAMGYADASGAHNTAVRRHSNSSNHSDTFATASIRDTSPLPSEIAADEQQLRQAKSQSLKDTSKRKSEHDKEKHELNQILHKTEQEAREEQRQEEEVLRRAMALSEQQAAEATNSNNEEEAELARILALSLQDSQQPIIYDDTEDEELQRIISQSNQEQIRQQQEEEAELERILRLSMMEDTKQPVVAATTPNIDENDDDDDETFQRVLRMSLVETSQTSLPPDLSLLADDSSHTNNLDTYENEQVTAKEHGMTTSSIFQQQQEKYFQGDSTLDASSNPLVVEQPPFSNSNVIINNSLPAQQTEKSIPLDNHENPKKLDHGLGTQVLSPQSSALPSGEQLLESLLYKQPLLRNESQPSSASYEESQIPEAEVLTYVPNETISNQISVPVPSGTQAQQQQSIDNDIPTIPPPVMEHRLMEMLQRPVTVATASHSAIPDVALAASVPPVFHPATSDQSNRPSGPVMVVTGEHQADCKQLAALLQQGS